MEKEKKAAPNQADQRSQPPSAGKKGVKPPIEIGGREGPDPVRYGDWENKGIASDF